MSVDSEEKNATGIINGPIYLGIQMKETKKQRVQRPISFIIFIAVGFQPASIR